MKILFDTNVILDVMLLREPFFKPAAWLLSEVERNHIHGFICATTVTTIYYLVEKVKNRQFAEEQISGLLKIFGVTPDDKSCLESALTTKGNDYEDAVLYESAIRQGVEGIVTRNEKDFPKSKIPIYNPDELVKIIKAV